MDKWNKYFRLTRVSYSNARRAYVYKPTLVSPLSDRSNASREAFWSGKCWEEKERRNSLKKREREKKKRREIAGEPSMSTAKVSLFEGLRKNVPGKKNKKTKKQNATHLCGFGDGKGVLICVCVWNFSICYMEIATHFANRYSHLQWLFKLLLCIIGGVGCSGFVASNFPHQVEKNEAVRFGGAPGRFRDVRTSQRLLSSRLFLRWWNAPSDLWRS